MIERRPPKPHQIASFLSWARQFCRPSSTPRVFPDSGFDVIEPSEKIEEELYPNYRPERFYPIRIGEIFNSRYQTLGKLGYGSSSTVWLCRDLLSHRYVSLKVCTTGSSVNRELAIYEYLNTIKSDHHGQADVRKLLDTFEVAGPHGRHRCLVHQPLGNSLHWLMVRLPKKVFAENLLRSTIRQILVALDYLHTEARITHTDIQPLNILLGVKNDSVFSDFEQAELKNPIARKILQDRTIYLSRSLPITFGTPVLCDLGEARRFNEESTDDIMPDVYRAPEVILRMKWDYKVDIWNVGVLIWDLFEYHHLFNGKTPNKELDNGYHLAEMIAILGLPPLDFLRRSEKSFEFWDENGNWKSLAPIPNKSLETVEERLDGGDKAQFLRFLRKMLCWLPEDRHTARELLFDPWLSEELGE